MQNIKFTTVLITINSFIKISNFNRRRGIKKTLALNYVTNNISQEYKISKQCQFYVCKNY